MNARRYAYFGASADWRLNGGWGTRHPEYTWPLGAPGGQGYLIDGVWHRNFSSGTKVYSCHVGETSQLWGEGCIVWSNGQVTGQSGCQNRSWGPYCKSLALTSA